MSVILLDELFQSLLSNKGEEQMTNQEIKIYNGWKSQALKSFAVGGAVATGLTWIGIGFLTGIGRLNESIDSCVEHILGMDGSRMQHELKKIILEKYGNNPKKMQPFSKHFYCEEVFNDLTLGQPQPVFRQRHVYVEDHRTADGNSHHEAIKKGAKHQQRNDDSKVKLKSSSTEIKQVPVAVPTISILGYGDPLDVLFGHSSTNEELQQPDESGNSKAESHRQKRARRKHRLRHRHQESESVSVSLGMAQLQGV
ncbi:Vezatin [Bienertia sinuspersici]